MVLRTQWRKPSGELNILWRRRFINWALGERLEAMMCCGVIDTHVVLLSVMKESGVMWRHGQELCFSQEEPELKVDPNKR